MRRIELIKVVEEALRQDFGKLSDLPTGVANTVANVYFRYFELTTPVVGRPEHGNLLEGIAKDPLVAQAYTNLINDSANIIYAYESISKMIWMLRKFKPEQKELYQRTMELMLDRYKFNITNPEEKSGFRRACERKLAKVSEINNLITLMAV